MSRDDALKRRVTPIAPTTVITVFWFLGAVTMSLFDDNAAPIKFTDQRKLECVEREIKQRQYVYPRRVQEGRMSEKAATEEIACMNAIAADYRKRIANGGD